MVNECLMFLRKKGGLKIIDEGYAVETGHNDAAIASLGAVELLRLVTSLPEGYRMVFNLFVVEGYSHKEIAVMLGITEGTSKSQLNKARLQLQKMIKQNETYYEKRTGR